MSDELFLIEKRGLYYRPSSSGYTGLKREAGRYSFDDASVICGPNGPDGSLDGLGVWREDEAPEFSSGCHWDVKMRERSFQIKALEAQLAAAEALVAGAYEAASEELAKMAESEAEIDNPHDAELLGFMARHIKTLTPANANEALEAAVAKAVSAKLDEVQDEFEAALAALKASEARVDRE